MSRLLSKQFNPRQIRIIEDFFFENEKNEKETVKSTQTF